MLAIRLFRAGTKNRPFYRVVVSESQRTPRSRVSAQLGVYDPTKKPELIRLDIPKTEEWLRRGAKASDTVRSLIERARAVSA